MSEDGQEAPFFTKSYFVLTQNTITQFGTIDDTQERGVLDIKNCRVKKHNFKDTNLKYLFGFIIMAKGKTIDFYVETVE